MKEVKKTPVPLPGAKPKSKSKDSSAETKSKSVPKPKATATIGVHKANGAEKPAKKSKDEKKEGKEKKAKATPVPLPTPKKPEPKKIATQEDAMELDSSEQSDDSDAPARDIQTKLPGNDKDESSSSEDESDSDSDSDESGSDEEEAVAQKPVQETQSAQQKSHAVEMRAAQPFEPPKGYVPVPLNDKTSSKATSIFENLQGKQVWHITAPAGLPLKDLQEITMESVKNGETVLNHKSTEYCFGKAEKSEDGAREIMIPQKNGYKAVPARISQTLHLQQAVKLPNISSKPAANTISEASFSITRSTIRGPRPQAKGLKMRYLPTGFEGSEGGILGESDSEEDTSKSTAEKRKSADVVMEDAPVKKSKKHRTPEEIKRREEKKAKKEKKAKA